MKAKPRSILFAGYSDMEENDAHQYYSNLAAAGLGAARFKHGLGFASDEPKRQQAPRKDNEALLRTRAILGSGRSPSHRRHRKRRTYSRSRSRSRSGSRSRSRSFSRSPVPYYGTSRSRTPERRGERSHRKIVSRSPDRTRGRSRSRERRRGRSRSRERNSRGRRRSRSNSRSCSRSRSRSRHRWRSRSRGRRRCRDTQPNRPARPRDKDAEGRAQSDYSKLIRGYDEMTAKVSPAFQVSSRMYDTFGNLFLHCNSTYSI